MKRLFLLAVVLCSGIGAANLAHAQSALKELEEKIRRQARPPQREQVPPPVAVEGPGPVQPVPQPAMKAETGSGYLGLIADNREDGQPGVRVIEVTPGGPAERAGLRPADLITGLGGVRIQQLSEMAAIVEHVPPDGVLEFEILRENRPQTLRVTFGRRQRPKQVEPPAVEQPPPDRRPQDIGLRLEELERRLERIEQRVLLLERRLEQARRDE